MPRMYPVIFLLWAAAEPAVAQLVTPIGKVINLLEDLRTKVESEGTTEAGTYNQFACFCKSTTASKSAAITSGRDSIDTESAKIQSKTSTKEQKITELKNRQKDEEDLKSDLQQTEVRCAKAKADYDEKAADLSKAISSLAEAIKSMENSKPSFLAIRENVEQGLALAGIMNLIAESKRQALSSFLQARVGVDPNDPVYKYHSQGIIEILNKLQKEYTDNKNELDIEWGKTSTNCNDEKSGLGTKITQNTDAMNTLKEDIQRLKREIADARNILIGAESTLEDDQAYLKDLTAQCEARAKDWDQRSQLRADELAALNSALDTLRDEVENRTAVNVRAMLQKRKVTRHVASPSFLQESRDSNVADRSYQARQTRASAFLRNEGARLKSVALSSLAARMEGDPFTKVKTLIQKLIERLVRESTAEATKKGWCDEGLGTAKADRSARLADTKNLNLDLEALELKEDELTAEIGLLSQAITQLETDLDTATTAREAESKQNQETMKTAQEGLAGVRNAALILKVFYKQAAKATVLIQASPVDEDTSGAGFDGAYKGQQESSKAIIGLLEVIESDFERTIRETDISEKKAHAEFVEFDRASRADISGKDEKRTLDQQDLKTTKNSISQKMNDMKTAQNLLDDALRELEVLKPTCIDTGMSYDDRVAKRQEEVTALKSALCILDTDGVEADCP